MRLMCLLDAGSYQPGDMPPEGYNKWHEWAGVQHKAGLRQVVCPTCVKWKYPQELSDEIVTSKVEPSRGYKYTTTSRMCLSCFTRGVRGEVRAR